VNLQLLFTLQVSAAGFISGFWFVYIASIKDNASGRLKFIPYALFYAAMFELAHNIGLILKNKSGITTMHSLVSIFIMYLTVYAGVWFCRILLSRIG
jgi:hypothetical protein